MKPPVKCVCICDPNCPTKIIPPDARQVSYIEKIIRYIPGPLVTAYAFLDGVIKTQTLDLQLPLYWIVFLTILILTPLYVVYKPTYIYFLNEPPSRKFHAIAATLSLIVWVFALGGPFAVTWPEYYKPFFGTILLVLTTLIIPVMEKIALQMRFFR